VSVRDGTQGKLHVQLNAILEVFSVDITEDGWYTVAIRIENGVNKLKIKVLGGEISNEATSTGAVIATLTARPKLFYDDGDAGRLDGAVAMMAFYSAIHDDATVTSTMAVIDSLLAT
jgi:selenophosphate synthetase-related protein